METPRRPPHSCLQPPLGSPWASAHPCFSHESVAPARADSFNPTPIPSPASTPSSWVPRMWLGIPRGRGGGTPGARGTFPASSCVVPVSPCVTPRCARVSPVTGTFAERMRMLAPPRLRPRGAQTRAGLRLNLLETSPWVLEGAGTLLLEPWAQCSAFGVQPPYSWGDSELLPAAELPPPPPRLAERSSEMLSAARSRCGQGPDRQTATSPRHRAQPAPPFAGCWLPACFGAGPGLSPRSPPPLWFAKRKARRGEPCGWLVAGKPQAPAQRCGVRHPQHVSAALDPPPPPHTPRFRRFAPPGIGLGTTASAAGGMLRWLQQPCTAMGGEAVAPPCPSRPRGTQLGGG